MSKSVFEKRPINSLRGRVAEQLREAILNDLADNEFREAATRLVVLPLFGFTAIRPSCRDTFCQLRDTRPRLPTIQADKAKSSDATRAALRDALSSWSGQTKEYVLGTVRAVKLRTGSNRAGAPARRAKVKS